MEGGNGRREERKVYDFLIAQNQFHEERSVSRSLSFFLT